MAPPPASTNPPAAMPAPSPASSSAAAVAAAAAAAKKEKRAASAASMAPRMQSQVQIWTKKKAELKANQGRGHVAGGGDDDDVGSGAKDVVLGAGVGDKKKLKKKKKKLLNTGAGGGSGSGKPQSQLRAPHRHDRYASFGIGGGIGSSSSTTTGTLAQPPTCLLCLVRFATRQQLRDHETLSTKHRHLLKDGTARRTALQRYAKVMAAAEGPDAETKDAKDAREGAAAAVRPPTHIKRLPRRRGDLAPVYTSYAAPLMGSVELSQPESTEATVETTKDYSAEKRPPIYHCCLLCRRRFRSRATLRLHERESVLHRSRTRDPAAVTAAVAAVNEAAETAAAAAETAAAEEAKAAEKTEGDKQDETATSPLRRLPQHRPLLRMRPVTSASAAAAGASTTQYRDRARERRLAFGQTGVPGKKRASGSTSGAHNTHSTAPTGASSSAATASPTPSSKGAAMLGKMGWTMGLGLGAEGSGRTETIATPTYIPGVGLGAQGGKVDDAAELAARRTESRYQDFVEQTQEKARQRYLALDRAEADAKGQDQDEGKDLREEKHE